MNSGLLFEYGEALVFSGEYEEALKLFEPLARIIPSDNRQYLTAVQIIVDALRRSGKREEAVARLNEALKGQDVSESMPLLYTLASTYEEMQQFDKAIDTYEEALKPF